MAAVVLACWPALWNGFPVLMGDSQRYLDEALGEPSWVSSQYYGYFLRTFAGTTLWLPVVVQAVVATTVVWLFLRRAVGLAAVPSAAATTATMLVTPLAFFVSLAMTDVWFGLGVLAATALAAGSVARRTEKVGLAAVMAFSAAAHPAALPMIVAIVAVAVATSLVRRRRHGSHAPGVGWTVGALVTAVAALALNNLFVWGTPSPNPHSAVVAFAYLLTNGDLEGTLAECEGTPACDLDDRPVANINGFNRFLFSATGPLETSLGGAQGFVDEATHLVIDHVRSYPGAYLHRVMSTGREQLTRTNAWEHAAGQMKRLSAVHLERLDRYATGDGERLAESRQYNEVLQLGWHQTIAVPVGMAGAVAPVVMAGHTWRRRRNGVSSDESGHAARILGILVALYVSHAFLIGTTTFAVERYGGRMLWLLGMGACAAVAWAVTTFGLRHGSRAGGHVPTALAQLF